MKGPSELVNVFCTAGEKIMQNTFVDIQNWEKLCYTDATILINSYFEGEDEFDKIFCKSILELEHILLSHI